MRTLFHLLAAAWRYWRPPPKPVLKNREYMELIVDAHGHIFIFRIRDYQSRNLLLPATIRWAVDDELPFTDDDAAAVVYRAVEVWDRVDESERCRGK